MKTMKQLYAMYYALIRSGKSPDDAARIVVARTGQNLKDGRPARDSGNI